MSNGKLLMVVHSNNLKKAISEDKEVIDTFLECAKIRESLVLATPAANAPVWLTPTPDIFHITYEDRGHGSLVATFRTPTFESRVFFRDHIPPAMITDLYKCKENSAEFNDIKSAFRDLLAFEAISRGHEDESIFVSQSSYLFEKNAWIQKRFEVKILSFVQALECFDLYLKKRNLYYENPYVRQVNGKAFHYWFLLKDLVPKFAEAWSISVHGRDVIQNGLNIQDVLAGLADKFQNALCSSDRIAMEYMKRPVHSTEWEMLYNFNYFCMLTTGIFDSLARLTMYRYSIPIQYPLQVSIRVTKPKSRGDKFVAAISQHNSSLASFIRTHQDFINLFYPMRDAVQHREPLGGFQLLRGDEGWSASLATVKPRAALAIKKVDQQGSPP